MRMEIRIPAIVVLLGLAPMVGNATTIALDSTAAPPFEQLTAFRPGFQWGTATGVVPDSGGVYPVDGALRFDTMGQAEDGPAAGQLIMGILPLDGPFEELRVRLVLQLREVVPQPDPNSPAQLEWMVAFHIPGTNDSAHYYFVMQDGGICYTHGRGLPDDGACVSHSLYERTELLLVAGPTRAGGGSFYINGVEISEVRTHPYIEPLGPASAVSVTLGDLEDSGLPWLDLAVDVFEFVVEVDRGEGVPVESTSFGRLKAVRQAAGDLAPPGPGRR